MRHRVFKQSSAPELLCALLLSLLLGGPLSAEPEWRDGMPWFDTPRSDYRNYNPDDLKLKEREQRSMPGLPGTGLNPAPLFYAVGAVLLGVLIYFVLRYLANRSAPEPEASEEQIEIQVVDLPEAKLPDRDLRALIDELLAAGNYRRAGMLLFQLLCNQFRSFKLLEITQDQTAREIQQAFTGDPGAQALLSEGVQVFEDCAYRPVNVDKDRITQLREKVFGFDGKEPAMT